MPEQPPEPAWDDVSTPLGPNMNAESLHYATQGLAPADEAAHWREVIGSTYFHLQLKFPDPSRFQGCLDKWDLPTLSLSRLQSSALGYRRLAQHCRELDRQILVTVPMASEVEFSQLGRHIRCEPGQFLLEYSDEPYEFGYGHDNLLWVLKLPESALQARVGNPSRFCAKAYDASAGVGRLFRDYVQLLAAHSQQQNSAALSLMGSQAIDLLALALQQSCEIGQSKTTLVRASHMARVEAYIREHLMDADLSPARIAQACGISLRYLHALFKDEHESVAQSIRVRRLRVAFEQLHSGSAESVAQVAYRTGFGDQAQFSRLFRSEFGLSPSELLRRHAASH